MIGTAGLIVILAGLFTAAFCVARALRFKDKLQYRLEAPNWDFNQSWASNIAGIGSILGIVFGASNILPSSGIVAGPTALGLSVFFGALIVLGPFTYAAFSTPNTDGLKAGDAPPLEGTVLAFVGASGLALWAATGEAATAGALFWDLNGTLPVGFVVLFLLLDAFAVAILIRYAWNGLEWIVEYQASPSVSLRAPSGAAPPTSGAFPGQESNPAYRLGAGAVVGDGEPGPTEHVVEVTVEPRTGRRRSKVRLI